MQLLTGKKKFVLKKTIEPQKTPLKAPPTNNLETLVEESGILPESKPLIADLSYSEKVKIAKELLLDSFLGNEDGSLNPKKLEFLAEHLKFKKPDAALGVLLDLFKIEQKEQDLKQRNKNFGEKEKPPAPILIQINNSPGSGENSTITLFPEVPEKIEEKPKLNLEDVLSEEDIQEIIPERKETKISELAEIRKKVACLPSDKRKDFFSNIQNQKEFLEVIKNEKI